MIKIYSSTVHPRTTWVWTAGSYSVAQSCLTLCSPVECSTPSFPVHHHLPELTQTHVHWVSDAIQPSQSLVIPFSSCLQSFPALGSFLMSQLFASGGQSIGASAPVLLRKSVPRQVDKKSRVPEEEKGVWGSWNGDRGLEFSRRRKGQTSFFSCTFLSLSHIKWLFL